MRRYGRFDVRRALLRRVLLLAVGGAALYFAVQMRQNPNAGVAPLRSQMQAMRAQGKAEMQPYLQKLQSLTVQVQKKLGVSRDVRPARRRLPPRQRTRRVAETNP